MNRTKMTEDQIVKNRGFHKRAKRKSWNVRCTNMVKCLIRRDEWMMRRHIAENIKQTYKEGYYHGWEDRTKEFLNAKD